MDVTEHGHYIAGKQVPAAAEARFEVLDPATNRPIARVASGGKEDVDAAVDAARRAFESPDWRDLDPSKRGRFLWLLGQQVRDRFEELSRLESLNVGKPLREAKGDVAYVYKLFEDYAGLADKIQGDTIPVPGARLDYTLREPLGVTAHIAPWNYPLLLACRGIAPALAAGNTVVLKPATHSAHRAPIGRACGRRGISRRRGEHRHGTGPHGRRGPREPPRGRLRHLHRFDGHRQAAPPHRVGSCHPDDVGARRQESADRAAGRQDGPRGQGGLVGRLPERRTDVLGRIEVARASRHRSRIPGEVEGPDREASARPRTQGGRADGPPRVAGPRGECGQGDRRGRFPRGEDPCWRSTSGRGGTE